MVQQKIVIDPSYGNFKLFRPSPGAVERIQRILSEKKLPRISITSNGHHRVSSRRKRSNTSEELTKLYEKFPRLALIHHCLEINGNPLIVEKQKLAPNEEQLLKAIAGLDPTEVTMNQRALKQIAQDSPYTSVKEAMKRKLEC